MIAFVLSGGGSLGATQAGMLEALLERDIVPDLLVGTSIGAANAPFLAAEPTLVRSRDLTQLWPSLRSREIFPLRPLGSFRALRAGGSLFTTTPLRRLIARHSTYCGFPCRPNRNHRSARSVLAHSIGILLSQRIRVHTQQAPADHPQLKIVSLPPVCSRASQRDFTRVASLIDQAREQSRLFLSGQPCHTCDHDRSRLAAVAATRRWCVCRPT